MLLTSVTMLPSKTTNIHRLLQLKHLSRWLVSGKSYSRLVLGIETSCDDTGAAVLDEAGTVLGESLHSQKEVHLRAGGIIPTVAQKLHREHIELVVNEALERSGVDPSQLTAVATTVKPGMALSLGIGLEFSQRFVRQNNKPFIPIHHMEAHALTVRMFEPVSFPFLVLLISGGHSLLAVARGVDDFLLLGHTLDEAPGDSLDKVARRLSLIRHPQCSTLSGGQAIELLAKDGDRTRFSFRTPMGQSYDCCFSFAGLRNQINMTIMKKEAEEGIECGTLLSCVNDIAAATQHTVACHLAKRTHRAILFCKANGLLPSLCPTLVLSGGVASNQYIRKALRIITDSTGLCLLCPPAKFCTDNGVMIAWNGVERLREGTGILPPNADISYEPKAQLGVDLTAAVKAAAIRLPSVRMKI
ncbi:tRNA N6-adenosine threonylcarbamoyltransferase, mitochondrial isoform X1 [Dunckerocampus dactyliophorus]|uniref:tRNA N6-adenosine threonylcarbamoyltransferase, mitochondrial isoform X1 n=2 Tax=Dunckerocampus dactyliophorus TaxID=161453 RepID=UPI0024058A6C|nr:tRNA N6-adenosine threonylcarbamoyltransferase, mitochondrial isoform X1 [Dunckerocampus dactyliophorus]